MRAIFKLRDELQIDFDLIDLRKNNIRVTPKNNSFLDVIRENYTNVFVSFSIYLLTFSLFYFLSKKAFYLDTGYFESSGYFLFSIILGALFSRKFSIEKQDTTLQIIKNLYLSSFISLIALILLFLFIEIKPLTRLYLISALFSGLVIESYFSMILRKSEKSNKNFVEQLKLSIEFIFLDGLILTFFCYIEIILNLNRIVFLEKEFVLLALIYISWVISAGQHTYYSDLVSTGRLMHLNCR
jgi:hypothetical protein